uniref:Uncharacterized protein n=1 Tax=Rhizophora mucronata TaxID=61149 RepID=A0A2P2LSH1_RHIMU
MGITKGCVFLLYGKTEENQCSWPQKDFPTTYIKHLAFLYPLLFSLFIMF